MGDIGFWSKLLVFNLLGGQHYKEKRRISSKQSKVQVVRNQYNIVICDYGLPSLFVKQR
jgi:hypothetical protein